MPNQTRRPPLVEYLLEYRSERWRVFLAIFVAAIKHSPVIALPLYIAYVIDAIIPQRDTSGLLLCLLGMSSLIVVNMTLHPLYIRLYSRIRRGVTMRLRSRLCEKIQQISFSYHDAAQSGRLHSKVMQDVEKLDLLGQTLIDPLLLQLLTALTATALILLKAPLFGFILLVFLPIIMIIMRVMRRSVSRRFEHLREEQERLNSEVGEMLGMLTLSRAHAAEHHELKRIGLRLNRLRDEGIRTDWTTNLLLAQIWATTQFITIFVVCFGGWLVIRGTMSIGEVVMFITFVGMTIGTLSGLIANAGQFYQANEAMRSIKEVLDYPGIEENEGKRQLESISGRVELRDVWFTYPGSERPVLKSINLLVEPNQTIALVGASGAGKTTFIKLLLGFYQPIQGDVYIDDVALRTIDLRSLRRHIGIVTQETFLFNGSVLQNLTHGIESIGIDEVEEATRKAHARDFILALSRQYETEIGDRGLKLSGGQKQRLSIARAILRKPRLLILDEATSALDSESERHVQEALKTLMQGRTTFVIAHRLSTVRHADRILVFEDGTIVEDGRHDVLLRRGGVYARLVEMQDIG